MINHDLGAISSLSILIEKKSRRSELALYALPRGLDSLYTLLCERKWLASVPNGDVMLFCLSMSGIMYYYEKEPDTMSPFLKGILKQVIGISSHDPSLINNDSDENLTDQKK